MSKQKTLRQKTIKTAVGVVAVVALLGAIYGGVSYFADSVATQKSEAEGKFSQDRALIDSLRSQLDKSGEAEKRFASIQAERAGQPFTAESLNDFLRDAKARYLFDQVKLKPAKEVVSDKPELANFSHAVMLRPTMSIQFQAVSDAHVFSFIEDLQHAAPGLVFIESVTLKRLSELTDGVVAQIPNGSMPLLVEAKIEFTWINIVPKEKAKPASPTPPAAP